MAELNTAVWGEGIEVNPYEDKLDENKLYYATTSERPTGGDDQDNKSQTYTLDRLEADGKIVCGQDFDLSPCYIMVDENCPWTKSVTYRFITEDGTNSSKRLDTGIINESKPVPVMIGTGYNRPGTNLNNVFNCSTSINSTTGSAQMPYFMLIGWKNNRRLTNDRVMQYSATRKYKTLPSVNEANFQPFVKFAGKSIIARIMVQAKTTSGSYQTYSLYDYCYKGTNYTDRPVVVSVYYDAQIIDSDGRLWRDKAGGAWSATYSGNGITAVPLTSEYTFEVSESVDCKASTWGTYLLDGAYPCLFGTHHTTISLGTTTTYFNSIDTHSSFEQNTAHPNVLTPITQNDLWGTADDFYEYFMRSAAYLGLFFTPYNSTDFPFTIDNQDEMFSNEKMYLGVIDENGVTHGEYTHGEDNEDQVQYTSKDVQKDSGVTPGGGGGRPDPDPNPVLPSQPGLNQLTGAGSVCYALSAGNFQEIWNDIYAKRGKSWEKLIDGLQLFGSNPLNAILAYRWYPFQIDPSQDQIPVYLGKSIVNKEHTYNLVGEAFYMEKGSFWYNREKNFINSKHCKSRLFLPFYGFVELPMSQVLSKELEIQFQYNMPDNLGVWIISFGKVIYDYYECAPYIDIPITGDNGAQIAAIERQQALSTALTVGSIAAAVITGVSMAAPAIGNIATAAAETAAMGEGLSLGANISALATDGLIKPGLAAAGVGFAAKGATSGISNIVSSKTNAANQIGTLSTNVPTKAGAAATTFLHLPFTPYIQFYTNEDMETANITEYKKTVGIACEKWAKISEMPSDSLLAISNPVFDTSGMTQNEIAALINALNGFYK